MRTGIVISNVKVINYILRYVIHGNFIGYIIKHGYLRIQTRSTN